MENKTVKIQQAFYGEVNRSHSCIKQTFIDPELNSFLIAFTDRPAALPPGVNLSPYYSGTQFSKYYVFTKTFPDQTATRAGMVFTHALIFNIKDILNINNLEDIFSLFVDSVDGKSYELAEIEFNCSNPITENDTLHQPQFIQQIISAYLNGVKPILFSGKLKTFSQVLQQIWNFPNFNLRTKLKFRTSFTPSDLVDDLTIVSIQDGFLSKWQGQTIISSESLETVEIRSHSEGLFLNYNENNPFLLFLKELNIDLTEVSNFTQFEKVFSIFSNLNEIDDPNIIRQGIRILSKFSPSASDGRIIKNEFIERFTLFFENKSEFNILALRNMNWGAFVGGENKAKNIVTKFINYVFTNPQQIQLDSISELVDLSVNEGPKNWWHYSITESIESIFKIQNSETIKVIWQLIDSSNNTLQNIFQIIGKTKNCDVILRKFLPSRLRKETCQTLEQISKTKKWYLFHADILLQQYSNEIALERQLSIENKFSLEDSLGINYIAKKISPKNLILLTLKLCDEKLIILSIEAILKNKILLKDFAPNHSCWLEIWTSLVLKTGKVFDGLNGKEQEITFTLLDMLIKGVKINPIILNLISETKFSDISQFKSRKNIWDFLPILIQEKFLNSTLESVLGDFLSNKLAANSIEPEIVNIIVSDSFQTKFLNENHNNIEPVIKLYANFPTLKDNFLADFINYYRYSITDEQSQNLGSLVLKNNYPKTARSIYDKSLYNSSFNLAYQICQEMVEVNWLESLWGRVFDTKEPVKIIPISSNSLNTDNMTIHNLPTVVILTAISEEYLAVRAHLSNIVDADQNDTTYEAGIFEINSKKIAKVFIRECGAKNTSAAQESERAIQYFTPDLMLFVGIAGSRKPGDFKIGDVIFPEKVYSYEGGKAEKEIFQARPDEALMSYSLMETAKKIRLKDEWKTLIKGSWNEDIKANLGVIASGEKLVEHYESDIGKILTRHYNDTSAVEMEGFGFAKAVNRQGRLTSNILVGVVRGISDVIEQPKKRKKQDSLDRRPDYAKKIASDTAAAFAFWLVYKVFK